VKSGAKGELRAVREPGVARTDRLRSVGPNDSPFDRETVTSSPVLLSPGHASLALPLSAGRDMKRVLVFDGEEPRVAGICAEELIRDTEAGRPTMRRVQTLRFEPVGELAGISTFDPATLEPFSHQTRHQALQIEATYGADEIAGGTASEAGGVTSFRVPRSVLLFDLYGVEPALRALPLADGYAAELEVFWPERAAAVSGKIRVLGSETVDAGLGFRETAWVVAVALDDETSEYRIGCESHELLAQSQRLLDGTRVDFVR